jgi:hypothetical protein
VLRRGVCVLVVLLSAIAAARAQDGMVHRPDLVFRKDSILLFGGTFSAGNMGQSLVPFSHHDDSAIVGGAYGRDLWTAPWDFVFSAELGVAGRYYGDASAEVWGAAGLRQRFSLGPARLSLGLFVGLSAVSGPTAIERGREIKHGGADSTLLFYFTPELGFQLASWPDLEFVYRLHHRSGLLKTLGGMGEGANAHVFGVRWHY